MSGPSRSAPDGTSGTPEGAVNKDVANGSTKDVSDKDLVVAFKSGDCAAYDAIYRRHHQRVRAVCYRILGNTSDAEEAVQETFLRCYRALGRFNGQYQLGAWLARIAANVAVDQLRYRSRTPDTTPVETITEFQSIEPQPEGLVTDQIHMHDALENIQPLHARALVLRGLQGLSHEEMAKMLGISPQQVKSLLHRARNSFRRSWKDASGWALAPFAGLKTFAGDRSAEPSTNGLMLGAASPAMNTVLERVAASVVAVAMVLSGAPNSEGPSTAREVRAPKERTATERANRKVAAARSGARERRHDSSSAALSAHAPAADPVAVVVARVGQQLKKAHEAPPEPPQQPDPTDPGSASGGITSKVEEAKHKVEDVTDGL